MNKTWKRKWIKALRSGRYKQGHEWLVNIAIDGDGSHSFCCLGVLCDILPKEMVDWDDISSCTMHPTAMSLGDYQTGRTPTDIRNQLGITIDQEDHLVEMNDKGRSFKAIATWIERNL